MSARPPKPTSAAPAECLQRAVGVEHFDGGAGPRVDVVKRLMSCTLHAESLRARDVASNNPGGSGFRAQKLICRLWFTDNTQNLGLRLPPNRGKIKASASRGVFLKVRVADMHFVSARGVERNGPGTGRAEAVGVATATPEKANRSPVRV